MQVARENGEPYWIVRGTLGGKQHRPEFSSREDALAALEKLNALLFGHRADQAPIVTRLSGEEVRNAETALTQLKQEFPGRTLFDLLDYYRRVSPVLNADDAGSFQAAFRRVKKQYADVNLADVCSWFMDNYRPSDKSITLGQALAF